MTALTGQFGRPGAFCNGELVPRQAGTVRRWPVPGLGNLPLDLATPLRESWVRLLTQAPAGTSLAVVVPVPLDGGGAAKVGTLLREAIEKVNKGEYGDAVTAARRAIDAMGGGWASEKDIVSVDKAQRSLDQRVSLLRHALHGLASPSAHGDPVADTINWDRPTAMAVIAGVSALAACRRLGRDPADADHPDRRGR